MNEKKISILKIQIILYLLSPFIADFLAKRTNAVDFYFLGMFIAILVSEWLSIHSLGKIVEK